MGAQPANVMTIGQLARRSSVPVKRLREYERLGLLYTLGRSESNYRLFDESTLWCLRVIATLRSLGLTLKEIQKISGIYSGGAREGIGLELKAGWADASRRMEARIRDLEEVQGRIEAFQAKYASGARTGAGRLLTLPLGGSLTMRSNFPERKPRRWIP